MKCEDRSNLWAMHEAGCDECCVLDEGHLTNHTCFCGRNWNRRICIWRVRFSTGGSVIVSAIDRKDAIIASWSSWQWKDAKMKRDQLYPGQKIMFEAKREYDEM